MRYSRILQYVNQVARTGSIRKAAEQLNATSTAVNKRIKDLEDELEVELFDRTPRGVSLTAAGEMFIHFVREQLSEEDRMRSRLDEMRGLRRGLVRIATSQALAGNFMPDLLAGFKKRSPNVAFHVLAATHSQAISVLQEHEVELVLIYRPPRTYKLEPIFSINQRLMASADGSSWMTLRCARISGYRHWSSRTLLSFCEAARQSLTSFASRLKSASQRAI